MTDPRHNPDLDAAFASPPTPPPPPPADIRKNDLLDEVFGTGPAAEVAPAVKELAGAVNTLAAAGGWPSTTGTSGRQGEEEKGGGPDPFGEAVGKLAEAADKLSGVADRVGESRPVKGAAGAVADADDGVPIRTGGGESGGWGGWAKGLAERFGGRLVGRAEQSVGRLMGGEAGGLVGQGGGRLLSGLLGGGEAGAGAGLLSGAGASGAAAGEAGALAGAAGGAGGAVAAAAGPVGVAVAGIVMAADAAKKFHDAVVEGAKAQQDANFRLAEFSAAMAGVQAVAEVNRVYREMEVGDRTAESAARLQDSLDAYEDSLTEINVLVADVKNWLFSEGVDLLTAVIKPIGQLVEGVNALRRRFGAGGDEVREDSDEQPRGFWEYLAESERQDQKVRDRHKRFFDSLPPPR